MTSEDLVVSIAIRGASVAYVVQQFDEDTRDGPFSYVLTANVDTGAVVGYGSPYDSTGGARLGHAARLGDGGTVARFAIGGSTLAWISCALDTDAATSENLWAKGGAREVFASQPGTGNDRRAVEVARSRVIATSGLSIVARRVRWIQAGRRKSAPLPTAKAKRASSGT